MSISRSFPSFAICSAAAIGLTAFSLAAVADPLPPDATYRPLPTQSFSDVKRTDEAMKLDVMNRQAALMNQRYDMSNRPMHGVKMSGGRKSVQGGVRVKLSNGTSWEQLANLSTDEIRLLGLKLSPQEKENLTTYLLTL